MRKLKDFLLSANIGNNDLVKGTILKNDGNIQRLLFLTRQDLPESIPDSYRDGRVF